jgi:hypothetical protein
MFPASIPSFGTIRLEKSPFFYVDKSLLIKRLLDSKIEALWLTRPRGWGKTMNMTMLKHFFQQGTEENGDNPKNSAFKNLEISKENLSRKSSNAVVFLSF